MDWVDDLIEYLLGHTTLREKVKKEKPTFVIFPVVLMITVHKYMLTVSFRNHILTWTAEKQFIFFQRSNVITEVWVPEA